MDTVAIAVRMAVEAISTRSHFNSHIDESVVRSSINNIFDHLDTYILTPKGTNPHPFADALHEMAERPENVEYFSFYGVWEPAAINRKYRIKSIAQHEYKVRMALSNGEYTDTDRYFTEEEFRTFGFPNACFIIEDSVRIRK